MPVDDDDSAGEEGDDERGESGGDARRVLDDDDVERGEGEESGEEDHKEIEPLHNWQRERE
jgi:hypothetical protein